MTISILGGGAFGTALAIHLAKNEHTIKVWEFVEKQAKTMQETRVCPLLPGIEIPANVFISSEFAQVIPDSQAVFIVVPSDKVESTLNNAKEYITNQKIIICSKGFAANQQLLSEAVQAILPKNEVFCLYGPTLAIELAQGELSGMVLAGQGEKKEIETAVASPKLYVELSEDIIGIQIGAALKNVVTIFVGIAEGASLGENTRALIFTRGIEDIQKIGLAMGAEANTFLGLTCVGDLTLKSRNRQLGIELGQGKSLDEILSKTQHVSEGIIALKNAKLLADRLHLVVPTITALHRMLFEGENIQTALGMLIGK